MLHRKIHLLALNEDEIKKLKATLSWKNQLPCERVIGVSSTGPRNSRFKI